MKKKTLTIKEGEKSESGIKATLISISASAVKTVRGEGG
jgi:hypothetical protein